MIRDLATAVWRCHADPSPDDPVRPAARALALAVGRLPEARPERAIAELRLFARLRVSECADVLGDDAAVVRARWRACKRRLFLAARAAAPSVPRSGE